MLGHIKKGKDRKPRRILLYSRPGEGKSTWANQCPGVLFLDIEDGLGDIDCHKTPVIASVDKLIECCSWFEGNEHPYKALAIDTADWMEKLIFKQVANDAGKVSIADIGFGKGYATAETILRKVLNSFEALRSKGITIILLAHSKIEKVSPPDGDSYDRYTPALHDKSSRVIEEWCDEIFFARQRVIKTKKDEGFGKERVVATGGKQRFITTGDDASCLCKNRLNLPQELPLEFSALLPYLPGFEEAVPAKKVKKTS